MNGATSYAFAVVCEAGPDQRTLAAWTERVLVDQVDWLEASTLDALVSWRGLDSAVSFLSWKSVAQVARERGIVRHGQFLGSPGQGEERRARLALRLFKAQDVRPDAVLLMRDTDTDSDRRPGLEAARAEGAWEFPVVLAVPDPKRECWILAGFEPRDGKEEKRLAEVRRTLGFDPRLAAEKLDAEGKKGKRNAKLVLETLMDPDSQREMSCCRETSLAILRERGARTGLATFLDEVEEHLLPMFSGRRAV